MKEIIIIPHIGIGQLKLGMAPDELEKTLLQMKRQWSNSSNEAMQMERCAETDDPNLITGRYMDNDSFFLVQYRNRKATEIGIQRELSKVASIKLFGLDIPRFEQFNDEYIVRYGEFHLRVHLELTRNAKCVTIASR